MEKKEFVFNGATLSGFPMLSLNLLLTVAGIAAIACGAFADCGDALTVACAWGALAAMETAWEHGSGRVVSFSAGDLSVRETAGQTAEESANALRRQAERLMAPYARDEGFAFWEVEG